jgi:hypothetical protein
MVGVPAADFERKVAICDWRRKCLNKELKSLTYALWSIRIRCVYFPFALCLIVWLKEIFTQS